MTEARQTEGEEHDAQRGDKVVRLPRDWLGPREELIPFGPRAGSVDADGPPSIPVDPPTSPADFWGEQSAAIQSALEAPAAPEGGLAGPGGAPAIRVGRVNRRAAAGVAAALVLLAVAVVAVVSNSSGPHGAPQPLSESKVGFAAVFSGGVSSILRLDLGRIKAPRVAASKVRRAPHRPSPPKRAHTAAQPRPTHSVLSSTHVVAETAPTYHAATYTSDSANPGGTDTHSETPPAPRPAPTPSPSRPVASRATVPATGESGALGPIQSPNG